MLEMTEKAVGQDGTRHSSGRVYAGFWLRFVASMIDTGILAFVLAAVGLILSLAQVPEIVMSAIMVSIPLSYFALLESSERQSTFGKRAMSIRVISEDGENVTLPQATGRFLGKYISSILAIGYIMAAFTERKQGLHDKMAGCLVVRD